jgi:hypothetical protein
LSKEEILTQGRGYRNEVSSGRGEESTTNDANLANKMNHDGAGGEGGASGAWHFFASRAA